jgi:hypothetical protein
MTFSTTHLHAQMDRFPQFLNSIRAEFPDDCETIADEIIDAELGDFCWDARIAEQHLGVIESIDDDETEARAEVRILGYFRGQYLVATCIVDGEHRLQWMPKVRHYDGLAEAENAFLDAC